jgi:hypothetical protein
MPLLTTQQAQSIFKREGTSQTYGQLVIFPTKMDTVPLDPAKNVVNSPRDITVRLIANGGGTLLGSKILDTERSKISLAAFTDNKQAVINLSSSVNESLIEKGQQENIKISNVNQNIEDHAIVVGGEKSPEELRMILKEAIKVDLFTALKSQESEVVEYNNLKDVELNAKFVYNFYIPEECDISSQENQSQDPLLKNDIFNVPRYVKLSWQPKYVTEPLANTVTRPIPKVSGIVGAGSYDFKNSFINAAKTIQPISSEGRNFSLVDVHNLDIAFANTNNANVFSNTINVTVEAQSNGVSSLPINSPPPVPPALHGYGILGTTPKPPVTLPPLLPLALPPGGAPAASRPVATPAGSSPLQIAQTQIEAFTPTRATISQENSLIRMVVPNASFSKLYMSSSVPTLDPSSKLSLSILAESVSDVEITRAIPDGFHTTSDFVGLEYVGYIILKERLNRQTGEWFRIDEYKIIGVDANSFIDTRVAYGEIYRYRMKTVVRFTQKEITTEVIEDNSLQNIQTIITQRLQEFMSKNTHLFVDSFAFFNRGISNPNSIKPINFEVNIFGDYYASFEADRIDVYQKAPNVQTLDLRTQKNSKLTSINFLNKTFNVYLPTPGQKIINRKVSYKSYYYESLPSKQWRYVDIYEDNAPPPPEAIKIYPNSLSNQIIITWLRPSDSQRDIAAYRVYRRSNLGEQWKILTEVKEMDVNDDGIPDFNIANKNAANLYIDKNVNDKTKYIYALTCIDIHGIESFLSMQIQAQLNPNFKFEKEEKLLKWISGGGATPQEVSFVYKKFLSRTEALIARNKARITVNTKYKDTVKDFVIRVTSLDTHDKKEYKLTLNNLSRVPTKFGPTAPKTGQ